MDISIACDKKTKIHPCNDTYLSVLSSLQQPLASFVFFMIPVSLNREIQCSYFYTADGQLNFFLQNKSDKNMSLRFFKEQFSTNEPKVVGKFNEHTFFSILKIIGKSS